MDILYFYFFFCGETSIYIMNRLTKRQIMDTLTENQISFPESASIQQLRHLLSETGLFNSMDLGESSEISEQNVNDPSNEGNGLFVLDETQQPTLRNVNIHGMGQSTSSVTLIESDLDKQLVDLQKRHKVLQLQMEIKQMENNLNGGFSTMPQPAVSLGDGRQQMIQPIQVSHRITYQDFEHAILKFDGEDPTLGVHDFFRNLEDVLKSVRADDIMKFLALRNSLKGAARLLLTRNAMTYEELKIVLIREFGRTMSRHEIYKALQNRKWNKKNETIRRYVLEMESIAMKTDMEESELIFFIIEGIQDPSNDVVLLSGARTMIELKDSLNLYEQRRALRTTEERAIVNTGKPRANLNVKATSMQTNSGDQRCWNCSKWGHSKSECPYEERPVGACYKCLQQGHGYRDCMNQKKQLQLKKTFKSTIAVITPTNDDNTNSANLSLETISAVNHVSVAFTDVCGLKSKHVNFISLFDTGSPTNLIQRSKVPFGVKDELTPTDFIGVGKFIIETYGKIKSQMTFRSKNYEIDLLVVPDEILPIPLVLGRNALEKFNIFLYQIDNKTRDVIKNKNIDTHFCSFSPEISEDLALSNIESLHSALCGVSIDIVSENGETPWINIETKSENHVGCDEYMVGLMLIDMVDATGGLNIEPTLKLEQVTELKMKIEQSYIEQDVSDDRLADFEMEIILTEEKPCYTVPRRLSYHERGELKKITDELLERGIIRPSNSPYASAILLKKKKSGEYRKCVDYRPLNKLTVRDNFPMPLIEDCIEFLHGRKYFTALDLKNGYFHVKMSPDSVKYTSFVTPYGQYEYLRMPFGLKNGPAVFHRYIRLALRDFIDRGLIVVFMDDILIATEDFEEHVKILSEILKRMASCGLELKLSKCKFGYRELVYLGYTINSNGIQMNNTHVEAVGAYNQPKNQKQLRSCLGLFSHFRKFIPNFATIAKPLYRLLKEDVKYEFSPECNKAFNELKDRLLERPVLAIYNPKAETELHCDASAAGFGAILMQKQGDGKFHPVMYFSRATTAAEMRYHSFELETLSIIYALRRFKVYLEGISFKIITDCNSLTMTLNKRNVNPRIARWALEMENFDYKIIHRGGINMGHVDALSRCHTPGSGDVSSALMGCYLFTDNDEIEELETQDNRMVFDTITKTDEDELDLNIQLTQNRDENIVKLRERLMRENVLGYELYDGLVFRVDKQNRRQLFIPNEMVRDLIRITHEKIGHLGIGKTYEQIKKHYWFPDMKGHVTNHIQNCVRCIMHSVPIRVGKRNLHSIPKGSKPFHTLHLDHFGPLPVIKSKKKYVLMVIDAFTKMTKLYAVNSTSTRDVIGCLNKYFSYYSRPVRMITDRGTCFTSFEFDKFLMDKNIQHVKVATASPQANGQVEKQNGVLKSILAKITEPIQHSDWANKLEHVEYAVNNTVHVGTRDTPSRLLFGVEQRGVIIDKMTEYLNEKNSNPDSRDLNQIRELAAAAIVRSQQTNEKYMEKHNRPAKTFDLGDFIVVRNVDTVIGTNKKFVPKYKGPYVIHKVLPNDRYVVRDIENCQLTQIPYDGIIEATRMKEWKGAVD